MAIYYFDAKIISRSKGQSIVACAAYRAADKLVDQRYDKEHDYQRKQHVEFSEILLPGHAPGWMAQREKLWNAVEMAEKRLDAQLAREIKFSLPRELTLEQNIHLTRQFVNDIFVSKGMVADYSIHVEKASDGGLQPHAHVLLTQREITQDGFGKKVREWNKKENLLGWRKEWAAYENHHLAMNGHDLRVDHRTLREQGIDLIPQDKMGSIYARERLDAYHRYLENTRLNGEKLIERPEIVFDVLTRQQSTFTHQDIARIVNRYTVDEDQFQTVFAKTKVSPEIVFLGKDDKNQERFTTRDMLKLESDMVNYAKTLHGIASHKMGDIDKESIISSHSLSPEQHRVLNYVVSEGGLKCVIGFAGTGKSRLLGAAKECWEESGYRVLGATLSGIAAENLQDSSGIESRTLASRFHYWNKGEELLSANDILVIDEAGMIDSRQMAKVLEYVAEQSAKIVLVGDPEQLQAIQAGAAFRAISGRTSYVELTEIWRQQEDWQKEATVYLATEKTANAIDQYAAHNRVYEFNTQMEAKQALVDAWNDARIADGEKTQLMLAYSRSDVLELNEMARSIRKSLGELDEGYLIQTERGERIFSEGDRVYFLRNDRDLGVKNGTLGTIVDIDNDALKVAVSKEGVDHPYIIAFTLDRYNDLDYGYAATIHKAQGITVDQSFVLASQYLDRHATYVGMTRHSDNTQLFWSKEEFQHYDTMISTLSRERSKEFSLDYSEREFAYCRGIASEDLKIFNRYPDKSEKDIPDWHADLFYGFDKKQDAKENFNDLFYDLDVDFSNLSDKEIKNEKDIDF